PALGHHVDGRVGDQVHRDRDDREPLTKEPVAPTVTALRPAEGPGRSVLALTGSLADALNLEAAALDQALRGLKDDLVVGVADPPGRGATKQRAAQDQQGEPG